VPPLSQGPELRTARLLLRRWRAADLPPFAAMNADARVMEFFPATLSPGESEAVIAVIDSSFEQRGYGLWAVEVPGETSFAGFIGLAPVDARMRFAPAVEVGWRLAREHWGHGFATEGARAAMSFAFEELGLPSLVAFTASGNARSRRVMQRLGMVHDPAEDFHHPRLTSGHPLSSHVLYRADAAAWLLSSGGCAVATPTRRDPKN
jgi:RimJ/RimL family protein N-acetyltransferase